MAISLLQRRPVGVPPPDGPAGRSGRSAGVAMMLASGLSNQVGAAVGALAFPVIGPAGVVAVRQWVAGVALLAIGRPRVRSYTWRQWWPVLSLALVFATMNLSLYTAIDRIGLGLAVTLEFLGPLSVALAGSRRRVDLVCALLAGAAVAVLARPEPTTDYLGIGLGLLAAVCWACYILLNRVIGRRLPGAEGPAAAAGLSALLYVPIGIATLLRHPPTASALGYAAAAGILSSAVPFLTDLLVLRRVPARFFGVFMSVNPVLAALVGLVILDQTLRWAEWLAIAAIVSANTVSVLTAGRRPPGTAASLTPTSAEGPARPGRYLVHGGERRGWGRAAVRGALPGLAVPRGAGGLRPAAGLVRFDLDGCRQWAYRPPAGLDPIGDASAMNVADEDVWLCCYPDFPLVRLPTAGPSQAWPTWLGGHR